MAGFIRYLAPTRLRPPATIPVKPDERDSPTDVASGVSQSTVESLH